MPNLLSHKPLQLLIPGIFLTGLLVLSFMVLNDLLISLSWAIIIAYVMWPPYQWLRTTLNNRATLSALIMTTLITIFISLAVLGLAVLLQNESKITYQSLTLIFSQESYQLPDFILKIPKLGAFFQTGLDRLRNDQAHLIIQFADWAKQWLGSLAPLIKGVGYHFIKLGVILVTVFFCFRDGSHLIKQLQQGLTRFLGDSQHLYLQAAGNTTRAVVYGLVLAALSQGTVAGVGYALAGVKAPVLFGVITALLAMIPMGATLVWLPIGLSLILMDQLWQGLGLLLWGFLVVSTIDNVIRPLVISGASRVPFLVVLIGVVGGLKAFGAIGLFIGPVILAVLLSVWQAWLKQQQAEQPQTTPKHPIWHTLSTNEVLHSLSTDHETGLPQTEVEKRLTRYGANGLIEKPPHSAWGLLLSQFKSFLIIVLLAAAILAAVIGDLKDGIVILVVVFINALLGFHQEFKAEKSLSALKKMLAFQAKVRRDALTFEIPIEQLVPGDIVILDAGSKIPADGRIIKAHALEVDESSLTGESIPVSKQTHPLEKIALPLVERCNMLYMNNTVTRGRAEMIVTATGMETEIGKLTYLLTQTEDRNTPLKIQLDSLGKRLIACTLAIITLLLMVSLWQGAPLIQTIFTAIALAVAAIPEGLPAVVTVTLALGMHRMARQKAIIKNLAAVETLGCTTVICTDKTGTLTVNQMTARALYYNHQNYTITGEGYQLEGQILPPHSSPQLTDIMLALTLCNNSLLENQRVIGDPMEGALLVLASKAGMTQQEANRRLPRMAEIPFDAEHKLMATFHQQGDDINVFIKGAPEVLLKLSLPSSQEKDFLLQNEIMARNGLRVLGVAINTIPAATFDVNSDLFNHLKGLHFIALVGLMDPPRTEVRAAIKLCQQAGIAVKMITGDQKVTALAIAHELQLTGDVIDGQELAELDDDALAASINAIGIFARTAPEQKARIIQALKADGHIVAMTGDGVNDAPALKMADIGIAMGITGADVTKEAATMILTDDNFATIVKAIKEGRGIYENMIKFIRFQLSTNMGAILTVALAPLLGMPIPFTATQLLWINIIMDGPPAMSLGVDPARKDCMNEAPRDPNARILSFNRFGNLFSYGLTMALGTLAILYYGLQNGSTQHATTLAFTTFVLFQVFNVFNARSEKHSTFTHHFFANRMLWLAIMAVIALQIVVIYWSPVQALFNTTALTPQDWLIAVGTAATILVLEELRKQLRKMVSLTHQKS